MSTLLFICEDVNKPVSVLVINVKLEVIASYLLEIRILVDVGEGLYLKLPLCLLNIIETESQVVHELACLKWCLASPPASLVASEGRQRVMAVPL